MHHDSVVGSSGSLLAMTSHVAMLALLAAALECFSS